MITAFPRRAFTNLVLTALATAGKPVGDGVIPPGGGWVGGVATAGSTYVPFVVASEITASHSSGGMSDSQSDWQLPYLIESYGVLRDQCEWMVERARTAMLTFVNAVFTIGGHRYGVQQVHQDSLGEPVRVDSHQPPDWHYQDGINLWITKEGAGQ